MARKDLSEIIVMDLEATCWRTKEEQGDQPQEVIEIGVAILPKGDLVPIRQDSIIVKPRYSIVSEFCTELTSLTQADVDKGIDAADAYEKLWSKYHTGEKLVACWGTWDFDHIKREVNDKSLRNPIGILRLDVKSFYAFVKGLDKGTGMMEALDQLKIKHEGKHHRGNDDAYNIAKILGELVKGARASICT